MNKKKILINVLTLYLIINIILIFFIVFKNVNLLSYNSITYHFAKFAGLTGLLFLGFIIFFGDMAKYFDKYLGLDKIIFFNKRFGLTTALVVFSHPIFFILSSRAYINYLVPQFSILPLALGTIAFYLLIIFSLASKFYKRVSNRMWQYLHIISYLIYFFGFYHGRNIGSDFSNPIIFTQYIILTFIVIIGIIYRTNYKIKKKGFYYVKIKKVIKLNHNIFSIIVEKPKNFKFKNGQFAFISLKGFHARHPFTISSLASEKDLEFTIKIQGKFTQALEKIKPNTIAKLEGPYGTFTIKDEYKNLIFIAGGIGITPFKSLASKIKKGHNVTLFYAAQKFEDLVFKDYFDKNSLLKKIYILSREKKRGYLNGYINENILRSNINNINESKYYVCGPLEFKNSVKKILLNFGVKKENIHYEEFSW